jgi:hypothetical protein
MSEKIWGHCPEMEEDIEYENRYTPGVIMRICMARAIPDVCTRETCLRRELMEMMMEGKDEE